MTKPNQLTLFSHMYDIVNNSDLTRQPKDEEKNFCANVQNYIRTEREADNAMDNNFRLKASEDFIKLVERKGISSEEIREFLYVAKDSCVFGLRGRARFRGS